jgi:hypothetical protein
MAPPEVALHAHHRTDPFDLVRGALVRVVLSVLVPVVWVSLTLVYVAFFAGGFSFFQDFVIVVVSLLALLGTVTAMWAAFGLHLYHRWVDW